MTDDFESFIIEDIKKGIISGRYRPGTKIPSENRFTEKYGISRIKVRAAFLKLEEMGYVYSRQGKGRFVKDKRRRILLSLSGEESFTDKMRAEGLDLVSVPIFCEPIGFHEKIFSGLSAAPEERVFRVGLLRVVEGTPLALHLSYLRERMFPDIGEAGKKLSSIFRYFRDRGHGSFSSDPYLVSVTFPTLREQRILGCTGLVPLLVLESVTRNSGSGEVLQFSKILYRSDSFKYLLQAD